MFSSLVGKAASEIAVVEGMLDENDRIAAAATDVERTGKKLYAVSACVTRLYAIMERFIKNIVADYLDVLSELVPYGSLPDEVRDAYRVGISHVIANIGSEKYQHLNHEHVIRWYHDAVTNAE